MAREALRPADVLVADLVDRIVADRRLERGDQVVALVGTAGATPQLELNVVTRAVVGALDAHGLVVQRIWQGPVMTSLAMAGISVTLLTVPADEDGAELLALLDASTGASAWPGQSPAQPPELRVVEAPPRPTGNGIAGPRDERVGAAIAAACTALLREEHHLTSLDQVVGDGDLGTALARGARAWMADPARGPAAVQLARLSELVRRAVGGTSGPLYAVGLLRASEVVGRGGPWTEAFTAGVSAVTELGGAAVGDGTMVDALVPAATASSLDAAVTAARTGAESTTSRVARRGRASYLGERAVGHPDPGAVAVTVWLEAVRDSWSG